MPEWFSVFPILYGTHMVIPIPVCWNFHCIGVSTVKPILIPVLFPKTHSHSLPFQFNPNHLQIKIVQTRSIMYFLKKFSSL